MKQHLTVRGSWMLGVVNACKAYGVDHQQLLQGVGLNLEDLQGDKAKLDAEIAYQLWDRVESLIDDPGFGIHCGANAHPTVFGPMGMLLLACESVQQSLLYLERYGSCITNLGRFVVDQQPGSYQVALVPWSKLTTPIRISTSAVLASVVKLLRLQMPALSVLNVSLSCHKPAQPDVFSDFFQCPVAFEQPDDFIVLDRVVADTRLTTANSEIVSLLEKQVIEELLLQRRVDLTAQVYGKLCKLLPKGQATQERIAQDMNMSVRKLQGLLKQENTSYKDIAEYVRQGLALEYIRDDRISLSEVAYKTGFANASNFSRTFKRWYGKSPSEFRRNGNAAAVSDMH